MEWLDRLAIIIPIVVAILVWFLNEHGKRQAEERKDKEERYQKMLRSLYGFYESLSSKEESTKAKEEFLSEFKLSWMYCPDAVIQRGNEFLDTVRTGVRKSDQEKEDAFGAFVLEIRKDSRGKDWLGRERTKLQASDYRHWAST